MKRQQPPARDDSPPPVRAEVERSETEQWRRWSEDHARRTEHDAMVRRAALEKPIHPRELAGRLAAEMGDVAPDWRQYRPQLGLYWGQLLRAQPETEGPQLALRESLITAVLNHVPVFARPIVAQLRRAIELALIGHECAAFAVAWEAARLFERRQIAQGEPPPPEWTPERRQVRSRNELGRLLRDLRRAADELGCEVEITVRPGRPPGCPHIRESDDGLRLTLADDDSRTVR